MWGFYIASFRCLDISPNLEEYIEIRAVKYGADPLTSPLFLSYRKGIPSRLNSNSIADMVTKYSSSFKVRITPHKLRHSLATNLYSKTKNSVLVSTQLGHNDTKTTALYTHIIDKEQEKALDLL